MTKENSLDIILEMNNHAKKLNTILKNTISYKLFSDFGKRIYFPIGIVSQAAEASNYASKYNCSVGMAYENGKPLILPAIKSKIPEISSTDIVGYAPTTGIKELRCLWQKEMQIKNKETYNANISLPVVVAGITNGISLIADLFINKNDPVIIPDLHWNNYNLIFKERKQANILTFPLFDNNKLNISSIKDIAKKNAINGKIVFIFNFPNNPTGYTPTEVEAKELRDSMNELAESGLNILIIIDDAYFGYYYEEKLWIESLFFLFSSLHENILAIKVDGATKEDYAWGLRIAFITFGSKNLNDKYYNALNQKLEGTVRSSISSCSRIAQTLIIETLKSPDHIKNKKIYFNILYNRYLKVKKIINKMDPNSPLKPLPFNSGYFMSFKFENAEKLRKTLLYTSNIGTISINNNILRFAYSSIDTNKIENALDIIFSTAKSLSIKS